MLIQQEIIVCSENRELSSLLLPTLIQASGGYSSLKKFQLKTVLSDINYHYYLVERKHWKYLLAC